MTDVVLDSRGLAVRRHRQRFAVKVGDETREWAADDLAQMVLGPSQMISTDALALAAETSTDVVVLDWRGEFVGRFVPGNLSGAALVKRAQLRAEADERGVVVASGLVVAKCRNQRSLLRALDAPATVDVRATIGSRLARISIPAPTLAMARPLLFTMEGQIGRLYMEGLILQRAL